MAEFIQTGVKGVIHQSVRRRMGDELRQKLTERIEWLDKEEMKAREIVLKLMGGKAELRLLMKALEDIPPFDPATDVPDLVDASANTTIQASAMNVPAGGGDYSPPAGAVSDRTVAYKMKG